MDSTNKYGNIYPSHLNSYHYSSSQVPNKCLFFHNHIIHITLDLSPRTASSGPMLDGQRGSHFPKYCWHRQQWWPYYRWRVRLTRSANKQTSQTKTQKKHKIHWNCFIDMIFFGRTPTAIAPGCDVAKIYEKVWHLLIAVPYQNEYSICFFTYCPHISDNIWNVYQEHSAK